MSNSFFQFKEFTIYQERTTLKVSTDSCVFGAWVASQVEMAESVFDIGAGTGLLMLMLAQKIKGNITGIEIDEDAFQQAEKNIQQSPYSNRVTLLHGDITKHVFSRKYPLIISNPPFYENSLLSAEPVSQVARHSTRLTLSALFSIATAGLTEDGKFALLLPYYRIDELTGLSVLNNLYPSKQLVLHHSKNHSPLRVMVILERKPTECKHYRLYIKDSNQQYTQEFSNLLKPYYLYL